MAWNDRDDFGVDALAVMLSEAREEQRIRANVLWKLASKPNVEKHSNRRVVS